MNKRLRPNPFDVYIQLQPWESVIVQTYNTTKTGASYPYTKPTAEAQSINGSWTLEFLTGGPTLPAKTTISKLDSWTTLSGDDAKNFSGTAKYTTTFAKPSGKAKTWLLDLGAVHETAEVFLNGKKLATLIGPSFQTTINATDLKATNTLEIVVL